MSFYLDWVSTQSDFNNQSDHVKLNVALLAERSNGYDFMFDGITFQSDYYQELAHSYLPAHIDSVLTIPLLDQLYSNKSEYDFTRARMSLSESNPHPTVDYQSFDRQDPLLGIHQVYFNTDFGHVVSNVDDPTYADFVKAQSKINYWENVSHVREDQYIDWVASCGLALKILGSSLDQEEISVLSGISSISPSWINYHTFVTIEIYEML